MPSATPPYVLIAYVPVIHRGYIELFRHFSSAETVFVIGEDLLASEDYLRKEIRAIRPVDAVRAIESLGISGNVQVLDKKELENLFKRGQRVVMPDEDISRQIAQNFLVSLKVEFYPVFLRWNRENVNDDQGRAELPISKIESDTTVMAEAYKAAANSPDIWRQVGAVLAQDGKVLARASNQPPLGQNRPWSDGDPRGLFHRGSNIEMSTFFHAEANLVAEAARNGNSLTGLQAYVTTFPCPPCAMLLAASGIKRLCFSEGYALLDGLRVLEKAGVEVVCIPYSPEPGPGAIAYPEQ